MYKLLNTRFGAFVIRTDGNSVTTFLQDPSNTDYQAYLKWLAEGNGQTAGKLHPGEQSSHQPRPRGDRDGIDIMTKAQAALIFHCRY